MSLSDTDLEPMEVQRKLKCPLCFLMENLPEKDASQLLKWMQNPKITYKRIGEALQKDSDVLKLLSANSVPNISWQAVAKHARGDCAARLKIRIAS